MWQHIAGPGTWWTAQERLAIAEDGLIFHYNAYEVAPYALGSTQILLPWETIASLLRPDGPVAAETHPRT